MNVSSSHYFKNGKSKRTGGGDIWGDISKRKSLKGLKWNENNKRSSVGCDKGMTEFIKKARNPR